MQVQACTRVVQARTTCTNLARELLLVRTCVPTAVASWRQLRTRRNSSLRRHALAHQKSEFVPTHVGARCTWLQQLQLTTCVHICIVIVRAHASTRAPCGTACGPGESASVAASAAPLLGRRAPRWSTPSPGEAESSSSRSLSPSSASSSCARRGDIRRRVARRCGRLHASVPRAMALPLLPRLLRRAPRLRPRPRHRPLRRRPRIAACPRAFRPQDDRTERSQARFGIRLAVAIAVQRFHHVGHLFAGGLRAGSTTAE